MPKNRQMRKERTERCYYTIGKRLRWLRQQKGLSTDALGRQLHVTGGAVAGWETVISRVKVHDLLRIAAAYEVDAAEFCGLLLSEIDPKDCETPLPVREGRKRAASVRVATMARNRAARPAKANKGKKK